MSDNSEVIRIGRGVPAPPGPTRRGRKELVLMAGAGAFIGAAVLGGLIIGRAWLDSPAAAPPLPQASPTPNLKVLDEQATCVLVVPVAKDGAQQVLAIIQKPDAADWPKAQKTHDDLRLIAGVAAPTMRDDINQQAALLAQLLSMSRTGGKMTFDMTDFKASGLRIGARCAQYAN